MTARVQHAIDFADEATPTRRAVACGPRGRVRRPACLSANRDGGKAAHYLPRRLSTRREMGLWSKTAGATIGA